jgi:hypothetical protein
MVLLVDLVVAQVVMLLRKLVDLEQLIKVLQVEIIQDYLQPLDQVVVVAQEQ